MDQELVQYLDQRFNEMRAEIRERAEETKRHTGVLIEDLRRQLQLVAEGLMTHIDVRHAEDRAYVDEHFRENRTLFQLCFQRLENLERKSPG